MRITYKAPFQDDQTIAFDNEYNITLGAILEKHTEYVTKVSINGKFFPEWWLFIGDKESDEVEVFLSGPEIGGLVAFAVNFLLSLIIGFIIQALTPKPKQPKQPKPAFGIAGITNAIAPGTPKFLVYGKRRVFGFLIACRVDLVNPTKNWRLYREMKFTVVYFMGAGPIKAIELPKINSGGTNIADLPDDCTYDVRLGYDDQEIFPLHDNVYMTYSVGKVVPTPSREDPDRNKPIIETTRGYTDKAVIILHFPNGLFAIDKEDGSTEKGYYEIKIEYKKNSDPTWILASQNTYRAEVKNGCFAQEILEFSEKDRWDISVKCTGAKKANQSGEFVWLDLMEVQYILTAYPGNSLLEISGIGSEQINSIESLESSALCCGRVIPVWDEASQMIIRNWTRSRAWICRDILLDADHCLGSTFSEDMVDDGSLITASTGWEVDQVEGYDGPEDRDYCDVIIGVDGQQPGWDILKTLTYEGDTRFFPIRGRLTYMIDNGDSPGMSYSDPGNIIEGSVTPEFGRSDKAANTIKATFADETDDYKETPAKLVRRAGLGNDYERLQEVTYDSICRTSQVARKMRKDIEKIDLVDRFWSWQCDRKAMRSVPLESVRLSYWTLADRKGVSGFVAGSSTQEEIYLDRTVTLVSGSTYSLYVYHKRDGTVEKRTVANLAGTWGSLSVTVAFTTDVEVGDIVIVGIDIEQIEDVLIDSVDRTDEGIYNMKASILVPEVYQIDSPLPQVTEFINAEETLQGPQQPIAAQVVGNVGAGTAEFKVAPGFNNYRGTSTSTGADYIVFPSKEPTIDEFFTDYTVEVNVGSGKTAKITAYDGATRRATLDADLGYSSAQTYKLTSPASGKFNGFTVESSSSSDGPWTEIGTTTNAYLDIAGLQTSTDYFRLTPTSAQMLDNEVGRWVIQLSAGDSTPPSAPTVVVIKNEESKVTIDVTFDFPLDRDTWRVNIELNEDAVDGTNLASEYLDISLLRDEDNSSGDYTVSLVVDLTNKAEGTIVYGRANIEDYFGNASDWTEADSSIELSTLTGTEPDTDADSTSVTVTNTVTETEIFARRIRGGELDIDGAIFGRIEMKITDSDADNDAYITFKLNYGQQTGATLVVKTSDIITNIGTDVSCSLDILLGAKNSKTSQLAVLTFMGSPVVTNAPETYPGPRVNKAFGTTSVDSTSTKQLEVTAQWSAADTTLSLTKHFDYTVRIKAGVYQT